MKYLVILADGMADEPIPELGEKTPLEYARTPNMDRMAREGACGMVKTIPDDFEAGSDIANMSILGYAPDRYYTGRGPLEALSMGVDLAGSDVAYRCNLVTVVEGTMVDFSAGHITSAEGNRLLLSLGGVVEGIVFHPGISYRNLLVIPGGRGAESTPPHDIVGQDIAGYLPRGGEADLLIHCMEASRSIFAGHPVNVERVKAKKRPATQVWPWSGGRKPAFPPFEEKYGKNGGIISAVDLLKGIGRCAGMEIITVPGATGFLDTDYMAKGRYALLALGYLDFVYVHIEAPDEAGHMGSIPEKVKAIERVDEVIGMIRERFDGIMAVLPDHPTPIRVKTHTRDPVPFVVVGKGKDSSIAFSENEARRGGLGLRDATAFLDFLFS